MVKKNDDVEASLGKSIGISLLLFIFFPIGIPVMWNKSGWKTATKVCISVFFAIPIVGAIVLAIVTEGGTKSKNPYDNNSYVVATNDVSDDVISTDTTSDNISTNTINDVTNTIILGETISTEYADYTFTNVALSYDVRPTNADGFHIYYSPDAGNVYIDVTVQVKNNEKRTIGCDTVLNMSADYNNGYTYKGFTIVEDKNLGFTYSNISNIDPLETKALRYLIQCPKEVEETDNPLFLTTTLGGTKYTYTIR